MKIPQAAQPHPNRRTSSDQVWPLRRADGRTWAEAKRDQEQGK
jgi:hypothetical protein